MNHYSVALQKDFDSQLSVGIENKLATTSWYTSAMPSCHQTEQASDLTIQSISVA